MSVADAPTETGNQALDAALTYANYGYRVIPIGPGTKHPPLPEWQNQATTNPDTIRLWWRNNPNYGVGIATGHYNGRWLFCVDVDTGIDKKTGRIKEGDETLADLEAEHGHLPATVEGQSGSGGRHLWFWSPVEITNDQAGQLGIDLDIRGVGGQIVCHPTIHPDTGRSYEWIDSAAPDETPAADAPQWLVDLLTKPTDEQPRRDTPKYVGPARPGDKLRWADLLENNGATFIGRRMCRRTGHPYELWARPGADHTSATLYYGGYDLLKVFTSNWPGLEQGKTYSPFGFYAAIWHQGDQKAAARHLANEQQQNDLYDLVGGKPEPLEPLTSHGNDQEDEQPADSAEDAPKAGNWQPADLAAIYANGLTRPTPTVLTRTDGRGLLYPGRTNTIFGESGAGKTWAMYIAAAQQMGDGNHVIILDFEDDAVAYLNRMIALGLPVELVIANSTYYPIGEGATKEDLEVIDALIAERGTTFVGIDSTGEAIAAQGWNQDKDNEVAMWMGALPRRWARLGPCVCMLDHMPHGGGREIGSQRKRAGVSGAAWEAIATEPFSKDKAGSLTFKVAKDRGGNYAKGTEQAVIQFTPEQDGTVMRFEVQDGTGRFVASGVKGIGDYCDAVMAYLEQVGGKAIQTEVRNNVPGDNTAINHALKRLVAEKRLTLTVVGRCNIYTTKEHGMP